MWFFWLSLAFDQARASVAFTPGVSVPIVLGLAKACVAPCSFVANALGGLLLGVYWANVALRVPACCTYYQKWSCMKSQGMCV